MQEMELRREDVVQMGVVYRVLAAKDSKQHKRESLIESPCMYTPLPISLYRFHDASEGLVGSLYASSSVSICGCLSRSAIFMHP